MIRPTRAAACALLLAFALLAASPARATDIGEPAPPLKMEKWLKGGPVDLAERKGKGPVVVEFWATWCVTCRNLFPHLTEMQKRYQDQGLVVIGVTNEPAVAVEPFMTQNADAMGYTVAVDDNQETATAYMIPFGVSDVPHTFLIGAQGELLWHGSSVTALEEALQQVLAGKYDVEAAKREARLARVRPAMREYMRRAAHGLSDADMQYHADRIFEFGGWHAQTMDDFARAILTDASLKTRDFALALRAADAAVAASEGKDAAILSTRALALFESGKVAEAIEQQKKALELATDDGLKADLEAELKHYQEPREEPKPEEGK